MKGAQSSKTAKFPQRSRKSPENGEHTFSFRSSCHSRPFYQHPKNPLLPPRTLIADSLPNGVAAGRHSSFFFRRSLSDGSAYYLATGPSVLVGVDGHAHRTSLDILYF